MLQLIFAFVLAAAVNGSSPPAPAPATTPPAVATTQPVTAVLITDARPADPTIGQIFGSTRMGQLFQGRKTVTLADVRDPAFWIDTIRDLILAVLIFIPRVIVALLFLAFFWAIYRSVRRVAVGSMSKAAVDPSIRDMLSHLIKWTIMGFGIVIACNQIGVQIAALLTGVSIIGLAVGFAAQETLANFIAGVVIFWDKPFKVGDWLELDTTYGQVQRVTFRSTRILDNNGQVIVYPNTHMLDNRVSNHSAQPLTRISVPIGIDYKSSIEDARRAMIDTTGGDDRVSNTPEPLVVVSACGASSVELELRFWITDPWLERIIANEYVEKCKHALDAAGIAIPFPHMQVVLENTPMLENLLDDGLRRAG